MSSVDILPIALYHPGPTQDSVKRSLAEEDRAEMSAGTAFALHQSFSASALISAGLDLEDDQ